MLRIPFGVSGSCTIAEHCIEGGFRPPFIFSDRGAKRGCRGEEIAEKYRIPYFCFPRSFSKADFDRKEYTENLALFLADQGFDRVAHMGYMTEYDEVIFEILGEGKFINIHPSLFENGRAVFPGDKAVEDAFGAGVEESGSTIHVMTRVLDAGRVLREVRVKRLPEHTDSKLFHEAIKKEERPLYLKFLQDLAA